MGRHSIPDPDEPDEVTDESAFEQSPSSSEPQTGHHHRAAEPEDAADYGYADHGYAAGGYAAEGAAADTYEGGDYDDYDSDDGFVAGDSSADYDTGDYGAGQYGSREYDAGQYGSGEYDSGRADRADQYPADRYGADQYDDRRYDADEFGTDQFDDRRAGGSSDYAGDYTDYDSDHAGYDTDYDEDDYDDSDTRALVAAGAPDSPQTSGGHRNEGEWTGSHRIVTQGRRGVSFGVIAALVTVVVVVAGFIIWNFFGDALSDRSGVAADRCLQGDATVAVLADPAIAGTLGEIAKTFNETTGPVGDHCPVVNVTAADSDAVVAGLTGQWPENLGDKPALWIPGSSVSQARLQAAGGPKIASSNSLVTSPVLVAVAPQLKPVLEQQTWATLPGLQNDPESLNKLDLPGWGSLRMALPKTDDSDASYLAAEAVAAASAAPGAPADSGAGAVSALLSGAPKLADDSTDTAMAALLDGDDPAARSVHAVVTTEQQLIHRARGIADAKDALASWIPPGPAAVADFPAILLEADWLEQPQVAAASAFENFLREPEQTATLAEAGFRVEGADAPTSDVTDGAAVEQTLSVGDDTVRVALANTIGEPVAAPASASDAAVSIMLDRSLNLAPVVAGLTAAVDALPPSAAVGLTTFDGAAGTTVVNLGALSDDIDGQPRRAAITSALSGLTPTGGAVSFTTLRNVYADALERFAPGHANRVLVITSGPHTDQSLDAAGLQDLIRSSADPARPVAVDVINVGNDPDGPTWESVAQISGGTYTHVPASDSPEMAAAISAMLK
ncbi:substrate-binding domain-containing protein [Mycobacterium sp. ACS4331]|uniref:substrate-binding domain-containing protein n=1 Tax=Mycobacterium sp. ACS4331 TaxID=1834121 RepID=UPI0007FD964D|nr:substrate-binding domain-containing protein [Mycobacterium sp. ACS4331]OBF19523.1 hypothetical protein A5727_10335 [Mycobacterium sp. ACS4331]